MSSRPEGDLLVCPVEVVLVEVEADADLVLVGVDLPEMMRIVFCYAWIYA